MTVYRTALHLVTVMVTLLLLVLPAHAELSLLTSTPDLAAISRAVGGARVRVKALALPTQDPHWVDARPNLALELSKADLLIVVGAELEIGWLPTLQVGSRNAKIQKGAPGYLDCSELVDLLDRPAVKVDRSMGDIHPSGSPHYLLDPRAAERVAVGIGKRLAELDPGGRSVYLSQTRKFVEGLRQARARWETKMKAVRGREVIAFHRSLSYLADWLGLSIVDYIEPKPGISPNPGHVADLIQRARQQHIRAVIQETWYPTATSELIAQKIGAKLLRLPGATNFQGGQTYLSFIDQLVNLLGAAL